MELSMSDFLIRLWIIDYKSPNDLKKLTEELVCKIQTQFVMDFSRVVLAIIKGLTIVNKKQNYQIGFDEEASLCDLHLWFVIGNTEFSHIEKRFISLVDFSLNELRYSDDEIVKYYQYCEKIGSDKH
jgi:hypothetical protein